MTGAQLLQAVASGLANGSVYGLVAMGFALTYGMTRVVAFAHGDIVGAALAGAVAIVLGTSPTVTAPGGYRSLGLVALTIGLGAALSLATYVLVVRPFARTGRALSSASAAASWIGGGLVVGLLLRQLIAGEFPRDATAVPDPLRLDHLTSTGVLALPGGTTVPARVLGVLLIGALVAGTVELLLVRTLAGHAMRAVSSDPVAAALAGIPWRRILPLGFLVAGSLAGVAGILAVPGRALSAETGVVLGLKAIAAALLWRVSSPGSAFLGGLVLGVIEAVIVAVWGPAWTDVTALLILVGVLAIRPHGLRVRPEHDLI